MTSWTVLRFFSWSSGISTPNLSWAATAISTMDSESMSRSSTKLLSGVTWSAGTPATSSMISPRPVRISSWVMAMCLSSPSSRWSAGDGPPAPGPWLGDRDHLGGVADARPETQQQNGFAGADLAALRHPGQGQRDRRGRGVAGVHDVVGDPRLGRTELAGDGLDDAQVRLVRDESGQLAGIDAGQLARLLGDRVQRRGGPAEHRLPLLHDERVPVLDEDFVGHAAVAAPHHWPDPRPGLRVGDRPDHGRTRAVGED